MRRLLLAAAVVVLAAGCGTQAQQQPPVIHHAHRPGRLTTVAAPVAGDVFTASAGVWTNSPSSFSYLWEDCDSSGNNCATAAGSPTTSSSYTVVTGDGGSTIRVVVTATGASRTDTQTSVQTGLVAGSGGATVVGTAAAPTPTCTVTVSSVSTAASDLHTAAAGSTVCLASGTYGSMTISTTVTQSPGVTLASAAPGGATVDGITLNATTSGLTIEGLHLTHGIPVEQSATNDTWEFNTIENYSNSDSHGGAAFFFAASALQSGSILYNQIDHVPQCVQSNFPTLHLTFSHNVCGPGIGFNGSGCTTVNSVTTCDSHYIQTEGISFETIDNNAFEGPFDSTNINNGAHNNVFHIQGDHIEFDNDIMWHTDSRAQTVLVGDDGNVSTFAGSNDLFVEDPSCSSTCPTISMWLDGNGQTGQSDTGVTWDNDTVVGQNIANGSTGGMFSRAGGISGFTVEDDISTNNNATGSGDYSLSTCNTCDHNVSQDGSASGTGSVTHWTPSWQGTTWTPTNGSPWSPPPAGYYQPNTGAGVVSTMGYQGSIGP